MSVLQSITAVRDLARDLALSLVLSRARGPASEHALAPARALALALALATASPALHAAAEPGRAAPAFELPLQAGGSIKLESLRGKVVYLDFWASWCGPCRQSFPWMGEMHRKYADQGLVVLAVNVDARASDAQAFLKAVPAPFPVAMDPSGKTPRDYAIKAMPTSVLIGRDGQVRAVHGGFKPSDTAALEAQISAALKGS